MNEGLVVFVRAVIAFFSLLIFTRILGKEQISQLTFFDYALGITVGSMAADMTTDLSSRAWPHWIGLITWAGLGYLMELIALKWRNAAKYIEGEPAVIIMHSKIMERTLKRTKYRISDIMMLLRNKGVFDLNEVDFALIEPNGQLSVLKKPEFQSVTLRDMNIPATTKGISTELVYDGIVVEENLRQLNKDIAWLKSQLKALGINDPSEAFLVTLTPNGSLYVDKYDDHIKKPANTGN